MLGTYIRIKIDGKRTFRAAPDVAGNYEYWLKSFYDGRQKWHRVGQYDGVKKAKLFKTPQGSQWILNWMLKGLERYRENGLFIPGEGEGCHEAIQGFSRRGRAVPPG